MDNATKIIATSMAIITALDLDKESNNQLCRAACLRATMIYFIRGGYSYNDFKKVIVDFASTQKCYEIEEEIIREENNGSN